MWAYEYHQEVNNKWELESFFSPRFLGLVCGLIWVGVAKTLLVHG